MAENTEIEWADHTFNPWEGCTKISPACDNCYAAERAHRFKSVEWGGPRRRTSVSNWNKPKRWERDAESFMLEHGRRQRVFCASLADVFDNQVPEEWRADLWDLIRECPSLDWLLLTKRPQNIEKMLPPFWDEIKDRVWLGTTVENQEVAERNIGYLLRIECAVRFLSMEPLLGEVNISAVLAMDIRNSRNEITPAIGWVIVGGESGPNARPSLERWILGLMTQCHNNGVPFLFKQWGEWVPADMTGQAGSIGYRTDKPRAGHAVGPKDMVRVGKKNAGRLLRGIEYTQFPPSEETPYV